MKDCIRHFIATIYYRGMKYFSDYDEAFINYKPESDLRKPAEILNHINSLILYTESLFHEIENTQPSQLPFDEEIERFRASMKKLDYTIKYSKEDPTKSYRSILQGPLSDILLHIGEISIHRSIAGDPANDYENYIDVDIKAGSFE